MKNTLKKILCTALAAVSLSAMAVFPSSLNKPESPRCCIHVLEAEAAEQRPLMKVRVTKGKTYRLRSGPSKNHSVVGKTKKGVELKVYKISYDERWYRVSKDSEPEKWIYAARTHRIGTDSNGKPYHDRLSTYTITDPEDSLVGTKRSGIIVKYHYKFKCKECDEEVLDIWSDLGPDDYHPTITMGGKLLKFLCDLFG